MDKLKNKTEEELKEDIQSFIRMGRLLTGKFWQDHYKRCIKPREDRLKELQERELL